MFDTDTCYKIIFDALYENDGLADIALKVRDHTCASVYFVRISGEILAYATRKERTGIESLEKNHVTLADYDRFKKEKKELISCLYQSADGSYMVIDEIKSEEKLVGFSMLEFEGLEQQEAFLQVNAILCQALGSYFESGERTMPEPGSMRSRISMWTLFEDGPDGLEILKKDMPGGYLMVAFPEKEPAADRRSLSQEVQRLWRNCSFFGEEEYLYAICYGLHGQDEHMICHKLTQLGQNCCVSRKFDEISLFRRKKDVLRRMDALNEYGTAGGVMREKDWYLEAVYSYASPIINKAGLSDYSLQALIEKDREKNTELYETLKMYFLCGNNVADTAARLHVHRNTLVYRLKQIRDCIGKDINDNQVSRELLAFMIMYDIAGRIEE